MVMTTEEATALIAAAQQTVDNGGQMPTELRCQYPSKRCDNVRTTKRGGGLHRLCSFHRQRANKNQWLVDQRRRQRRERDVPPGRSSTSSSPMASPTKFAALDPAILNALDVLDAGPACAPLGDDDLRILQALLFDEDDDELSELSDGFSTDSSMDWVV